MTSTNTDKSLAIIGAGAAGMFTAANLAELCPGLQIDIYEAGRKVLAKVEISGGGRCNVTHDCFDIKKLSEAYPRGRHQLLGPFSKFSPKDTFDWFAKRNVDLKAEEDGRVFPVTDSSATIINCIMSATSTEKINIHTNAGVKSVKKINQKFQLDFLDGSIKQADYLLIATGSSKSGHALAQSLGHGITALAPSLFTFKAEDFRIKDLAGISFEDVHLTLQTYNGKTFKQSGPLLITHWGLSGPAVLRLSAIAARELAEDDYQAKLTVNWLAQNNTQQLRQEIAALRKKLAAKSIGANPQFSLTRRFWERLINFCKIPLELHFFELSNQHLDTLVENLVKSEIEIVGKGEFKEEFVTCGGISLQEVDFRSFESKLVKNLYLAGEILDIDAITGGYNFQAAWTAGYLVSQAIAARFLSET